MPNLSFVLRHGEGEPVAQVALTKDESDAVCACWRRSPTTRELQIAEDVFRRCKTGRTWLACDCRNSGAPP